jgi:hypothetical protein
MRATPATTCALPRRAGGVHTTCRLSSCTCRLSSCYTQHDAFSSTMLCVGCVFTLCNPAAHPVECVFTHCNPTAGTPPLPRGCLLKNKWGEQVGSLQHGVWCAWATLQTCARPHDCCLRLSMGLRHVVVCHMMAKAGTEWACAMRKAQGARHHAVLEHPPPWQPRKKKCKRTVGKPVRRAPWAHCTSRHGVVEPCPGGWGVGACSSRFRFRV